MNLHFYKYEGAGNDFVIIDGRDSAVKLDESQIRTLCERRFCIGSDGLMILSSSKEEDFDMQFFNPDGSSGMMCGNGGRCIVRFAQEKGILKSSHAVFSAPDGVHRAEIIDSEDVALCMKNVTDEEYYPDGIWLDTGTSHFVMQVKDVTAEDVVTLGRKIRYEERFSEHNGCNVNFYSVIDRTTLRIRTYERGVENETYACGTGITATALAYSLKEDFPDGSYCVKLLTERNTLSVSFLKHGRCFSDVVLTGPARKVYEGDIDI